MTKSKPQVKTVTVVYYGSDDLFDMLSDYDLSELRTRVSQIRPEDLPALPMVMAGSKLVKLAVLNVVLGDKESLELKPSKNRRAQGDLKKDKFFIGATKAVQDSVVNPKSSVALVPYYLLVDKVKVK